MEYRDLLDENRNLTGKTILKGEEIPEGNYISVVAIFIENSKGEFLLQKRSLEKGGNWATTAGHPKSGETSLQGIYTETFEELGLSISNPTLFKSGKSKNRFYDLYYIKQDVDLNALTLQEEEVSDVMWATKDQIFDLIAKGNFKKSHEKMFLDCFEYLEKKNSI